MAISPLFTLNLNSVDITSLAKIKIKVIAILLVILTLLIASPVAFACPQGMVEIQGGTFRIGADDQLPEERSAQAVTITGFCMDAYEVTNAQFAQFVKETGYITVAERPLSVEQFPDLSDEERSPGSVVFQPVPPGQPVQELSWWHWVNG